MSAPGKISLSGLPRAELEALAERLLAENDALRQAIAELKAEVATLKGVKGRPKLKPSAGRHLRRSRGRLPRPSRQAPNGRAPHPPPQRPGLRDHAAVQGRDMTLTTGLLGLGGRHEFSGQPTRE